MNGLIFVVIAAFSGLAVTLGQVLLLDQLKYYTSQNLYASEEYFQLKAPFSLEGIMTKSEETAVQTCQNSFKWERWNCPRSDFFRRRSSESLLIDREDSYVNAISTAAIFYSITKNCSSGIIAGCGTCSGNDYTSQCSDNPKEAEQLLKEHVSVTFSEDFYGRIAKHNYKVVINLLEKSLSRQCMCAVLGPKGACAKENCLQVLKPFADIAADIRQMYEEGIQLSSAPENSRVLWNNIPLDALVYIKDSPNYCDLDAVPHWNGMRGRQCSTALTNNGKLLKEDRRRCRHLCRECGYTVMPKKIAIENPCNCKFTWDFQVQCDVCVTVKKQYNCY